MLELLRKAIHVKGENALNSRKIRPLNVNLATAGLLFSTDCRSFEKTTITRCKLSYPGVLSYIYCIQVHGRLQWRF